MPNKHTQRSALDVNTPSVHKLESVTGKESMERSYTVEVTMLVINRVKQIPTEDRQKVADFHNKEPIWAKECFHATDHACKIVDVGTAVVGTDQLSLAMLFFDASRDLLIKEFWYSGDPARCGHLGQVPSRVNPEHSHTCFFVMTE